jgi:threonine/homoserine/homoserine lactone efflux protein
MAASSVVAFWLVGLLLIAVPGADWAFVLGWGLRARSVIPAAGGIALGYAGLTIVVAAGVGVLVARSPAVLTGLSIAGAAYLLWHGARTFAGAAAPAAPPPGGAAQPPGCTSWQVLVKGIGVSALNPKGLLIFLALLPQFTSPRWAWPLAAQLGLLGLVFVVTCAVFYTGLGSAARQVLRARPAAARRVVRVSGVAMAVVGGVLLAERLIA